MKEATCPCCGSWRQEAFYEVRSIPTNSCLLVSSAREAIAFPTADIELAVCHDCGFIFNSEWEPQRTVYSDGYEETQAYSPTFNAFNEALARDLVERHGINRKTVLEIGCGKGEFVTLLCELGDNRGIAYDPSFVPARRHEPAAERVRFFREFFTEETVLAPPDLMCCKMTLEHVAQPGRFVRAMRRVLASHEEGIVFVQVPDAARILKEAAFWDVYYEHCNYFTASSLERLFRKSRFRDIRLWRGYADQYLMIEGRPLVEPNSGKPLVGEGEASPVVAEARLFTAAVASLQAEWRTRLRRASEAGRRVVLWGSGSKAVSFLTTLGIRREVEYVVDVNPHRHGKYMPGTGQLIVAPDFLPSYRPDEIVVMNPIYVGEISSFLSRVGLRPTIEALGALERQAS